MGAACGLERLIRIIVSCRSNDDGVLAPSVVNHILVGLRAGAIHAEAHADYLRAVIGRSLDTCRNPGSGTHGASEIAKVVVLLEQHLAVH